MTRLTLLVAVSALATLTVATSADAGPKKPKKKPVATAEAKPAEEAGGEKKKPVTAAAATDVPAAVAMPSGEFDRGAASSSISEISLQRCKATNAPRGEGHVQITFTASGAVDKVTIDKGPWVGTPVGKCMAKEFKKAKVPAFKGDAVTVGKTFKFE